MIKVRQLDSSIGYIVMCPIFIAFRGGTFVICEQINITVVSSQELIPVLLSMEDMITFICRAVGFTIVKRLWSGESLQRLATYLQESAQSNLADIYGPITGQSSYPNSNLTHDTVNQAYIDIQRLMMITASCLYLLTWRSAVFWEDVNVKNIGKMKGFWLSTK